MSTTELYLQVARDQLDEQFRRGRGFESRAGTAAALAAALAGVAAVLLKDFSRAEPHNLPGASIVLAGLVALAFMGAIYFSLKALLPHEKWQAGPQLKQFLEGFDRYPATDPIHWTGKQVARSVINNEDLLRAKAKAVSWAVKCLGIMGLVTICLGVVNLYG